jgi:signal transduction histidine kinase
MKGPRRAGSDDSERRRPLLIGVGGPIWRLRGVIGRYLSVRGKLTLWYGAMCAITLAVAGMAMYVYVQHSLDGEIDQKLQQTAAAVNGAVGQGLTGAPSAKMAGPGYTPFYVQKCDSTVKGQGLIPPGLLRYCDAIRSVLDRDSAGLSAPGQFEQVRLEFSAAAGSSAIPGQVVITASGHDKVDLYTGVRYGLDWYEDFLAAATGIHASYLSGSSGSTHLREYLSPLQLPPAVRRLHTGGALEVFQNRTTYDSIQHTLLLTLLLGAPLGLLLALIAGWWIARAALRPINRISRTVRIIGESRDLSRRLNFVGPDDEVGRLAATFDGMMVRLERVFETQKRFIADASHELRTPLTAIRGNADLLRIAPPEDRDACLSAIRREAERMTRLVSDLLLLAEADVAEQQIQIGRVDLDDVVTDVFQAARVISGGRVDVVLENADPVCVPGDADRIKQLLLNLMDNAVKFTPEGGTVSIGMWREGEMARIDVADSGVGIPPEEQAAIFERFYRVEESRSKRGSGLGLAISTWIVHAHNGSISVSSQPGKGSTFTVRLPIAPAQTAGAGAGTTHAAE